MAKRKVRNITLHASSAETATGNGTSTRDAADLFEARLLIDITAISGASATITITVQDSDDNTTWYDHTSSAGLTATGQTGVSITNFSQYVRIRWVISGTTPSVTFKAVFSGKS